jgi:hypothetical protein
MLEKRLASSRSIKSEAIKNREHQYTIANPAMYQAIIDNDIVYDENKDEFCYIIMNNINQIIH